MNPGPARRTTDARRSRPPILAAAIVTGLTLAACSGADDDGIGSRQSADLHGQGDQTQTYANDAVELVRRDDGLTVTVDFPTPEPGSYEYPTADMVPPSAAPHPPIDPGDETTAEVFTLWLFAFNQPGRCTDGACDLDDIGDGAAAQGGIYQVDGRLATGATVDFGGTIRIGQRPSAGAPLFNPADAEVHVAVAPHGRVLSGPDLWRQLNGSVGDTTRWWAAAFTAP
ncbi:MAG: hypothetical protein AAGA93_22035 [Actinomycetota bacterium]